MLALFSFVQNPRSYKCLRFLQKEREREGEREGGREGHVCWLCSFRSSSYETSTSCALIQMYTQCIHVHVYHMDPRFHSWHSTYSSALRRLLAKWPQTTTHTYTHRNKRESYSTLGWCHPKTNPSIHAPYNDCYPAFISSTKSSPLVGKAKTHNSHWNHTQRQ